MKQITLIAIFILFGINSEAQSEKYVNTMREKILVLDTSRDVSTLKDVSATFERIADAEKTQWLAYYYAALAQVNAGYELTGGQMGGDMTKTLDPIADKAEALINKAEALSKDNAEIFIVKKMIASLRMMADPMSRYMQYGPIAQQALETAKRINAEIPRIYLLEGQDQFFTPEQFGGSKVEAKKLFEKALQKFASFKTGNELEPKWGIEATQYFLSQMK